jgi:hypothetical protein
LDLFEKISAGVSAAVVVVLGALYLLVPPPPNMPWEFRDRVQWEPSRPSPGPGKVAPAAGGQTPAAPPATGPTDAEIKKQLVELGVRPPPGSLERRSGKVSRRTLNEIKEKSVWMEELKLARSVPLRTRKGDRRLKLDWIAENSRLRNWGFEEGDVVDLIDGVSYEFNDQSSAEYYRLFQDKIEKLESGGAVSITISRRGQPLHLEFSLR